MAAKMRKWGIHFDHPWSKCVKKYGAPVRLHIHTPWNFWTIGAKSQVFDRKTNTWTDRFAYITSMPKDHLTRTKKQREKARNS